MIRLAAALCMCATPISAADTKTWSSLMGTSYVELGPPLVSGAVASVTFHDEPLHSHDEDFTLSDRGIDVDVRFNWNAGAADTITVFPPDGYIAVPDTLTPGESAKGVSHIYKYLGG